MEYMEHEPKKSKYPKSVIFIISNEFCERFSFYGMRAILTLYLTQQLLYSEDTGTVIYHLFAMLSYFTPVLGAIISDSCLGKFRTILYVSILYAMGNIIISVGSIPNTLQIMKIVSLVGLAVIGFGTGGIKPCVSAFGGDQFEPGQEKELQKFFSFFYIAINSGSVFSTFLTPILREDVHCFGTKTCYPLAFGVPAILMIVSIFVFVCGKSMYKINPPEGNIVVRVFQCICHALSKKWKNKEKKKEHWLDYAEETFDKRLISDIKIALHVMLLYIPLPVFWALFDQQGSRWTLQATRMNGEFFGYHIKPDQMQVVNPLMIVIFIPLFDYIFYPLLKKCHLLTKPLQRITVGGFLTAISFVVAGLLEMLLESSYPTFPAPGFSELTIINNSPCNIQITGDVEKKIDSFGAAVSNLHIGTDHTWEFAPDNCTAKEKLSMTFNSTFEIESMMITLQNDKLLILKGNDTKKKSKSGEPNVRLFFNTDYEFSSNFSSTYFKLIDEKKSAYISPDELRESSIGSSKYCTVVPGTYGIYIPTSDKEHQDTPVGKTKFESGGTYIAIIYQNSAQKIQTLNIYTMVTPNNVPILYQLPQIIILTAGEIMISVTGLEFSYSQAPVSMKAVLQAAWLLTVAFGNLLDLVVAQAQMFKKQSHELLMFACLMALDMVVFAIMAYFYKYVSIGTDNEEESAATKTNKSNDSEAATATTNGKIDEGKAAATERKGKSNEAFEEETDFNK